MNLFLYSQLLLQNNDNSIKLFVLFFYQDADMEQEELVKRFPLDVTFGDPVSASHLIHVALVPHYY